MVSSPVLSQAILGTWELISREDKTHSGDKRVDPALGADPFGLLVYDRGGRFAAQFMRRDRSAPELAGPEPGSAPNNTRATNGYDAYFGTYSVDDGRGVVAQFLQAALSPENVGQTVERALEVTGDTLTIRIDTATADGEPILRVLTWRRIA